MNSTCGYHRVPDSVTTMKKSALSGLETKSHKSKVSNSMFWILFLYVSFEYAIYLPAVYLTCHGLQLWNMDLYWRNAASDCEVAFGRHSNYLRFAPGHGKGVGGKHMEKTWDTLFFSQTYFIYLQWCRISLIKSSGQVGCLQDGIFSYFYNRGWDPIWSWEER